MKLRIYFKPSAAVAVLAAAAVALGAGALASAGIFRLALATAGVLYGLLALAAFAALLRVRTRERPYHWERAERLLIVAPHQDDCVIGCGGIAIRNIQLGGPTRIVYLVQEPDPALRERRRAEAHAAWRLAGLPDDALVHLDLLPPLHERDPARLVRAAQALSALVREFAPTVITVPAFEGGHVHHDMANHLLTRCVDLPPQVRILECPEYSPFFSWRATPHRVIALCTRCVAGLVAYYGPPDGIDERPVFRLQLDAPALALKRRMLRTFESQQGESLAQTNSYADRFMVWSPTAYRARPFCTESSYARRAMQLEQLLPAGVVRLLLPGMRATHGREPGITNLDEEFGQVRGP